MPSDSDRREGRERNGGVGGTSEKGVINGGGVVLDLVKFMFNMFIEGREGREGVPTSAVTLFQGQWHGFQRLGVSPLKTDIFWESVRVSESVPGPGGSFDMLLEFCFFATTKKPHANSFV